MAVHTGPMAAPLISTYASPLHLDEPAADFPDTNFVILHAGQRARFPLALNMARWQPNATRPRRTPMDMITAEVVAVAADLTVEQDCTAMAAAAVGRWGRIDVLDNNVGIEGPGTILDATSEDWDRVMAVNVRTIVQASRAVVPVMATGGGGSIVNLSSISALRPAGSRPPPPRRAR